VGKVRGPEQTIVPKQFDIPLCGILFSALEEKLLPGEQLARQRWTLVGRDPF